MRPHTIAQCVRDNLETYLRERGPTDPDRLYAMVLAVVEKPLLEVVMAHTAQNQSRAAQWLGLNRNTLRKKLIEHKLLDQ